MARKYPLKVAKRACDNCHRRKIKCVINLNALCDGCRRADLSCTYELIPQKKGPKAKEAKAFFMSHNTQSCSQQRTYLPPSVAWQNTTRQSVLGLISPEVVQACIDFFFESLYELQPILYREQIQTALLGVEQNIEEDCLIGSICSYVLLQPNLMLPPNMIWNELGGMTSYFDLANLLINHSARKRREQTDPEHFTHKSIVVSYFFFSYYQRIIKPEMAWHYLREAITQAQLLGMQDEASYRNGCDIERFYQRNLYWLLLVHERAFAIPRHYSITLDANIGMPLARSLEEQAEIFTFVQLINLYKPFDVSFMAIWNRSKTSFHPELLEQIHYQISNAVHNSLKPSAAHAALLEVSRSWLRTIVWQLAFDYGLTTLDEAHITTSIHYPRFLATTLIFTLHQFPYDSIKFHGISLVEKIFPTACLLSDFLECVPIGERENESELHAEIRYFLGFFSMLGGEKLGNISLWMQWVNRLIQDAPRISTGNAVGGTVRALFPPVSDHPSLAAQ